MSRPRPGRSNVLVFHTKHWFARERAAKRVLELEAELEALEAWMEPDDERNTAITPAPTLVSARRGNRDDLHLSR